MATHVIDQWHEMVNNRDPSGLAELLHDDVVFHSPVVHTPQAGKAITTKYLTAAFHVLINDSFTYVREIRGDQDTALEFRVEIDGIVINGVDLISYNRDNQITDFKVLLRPLQAVNLVHKKMGAMLQR